MVLAASCFGIQMRLTRIEKDLNLYIFGRKYVIQTDRPIVGMRYGQYFDLDLDLFNSADQWSQEIITTHRIKTGTTYTTVYTSEGAGTVASDQYQYQDQIRTYTFKPVGVILNQKPMNLEAFTTFVNTRTQVQPLATFTSLVVNEECCYVDKDIQSQYFPSAASGNYQTMDWLVNAYATYPKEYKHRIYPIYNKLDQQFLVGVFNFAKKQKFIVADKIYSMALFEYN